MLCVLESYGESVEFTEFLFLNLPVKSDKNMGYRIQDFDPFFFLLNFVMAITLGDKNKLMVFTIRNNVPVHIGDFTLDKVEEFGRWSMVFTADEKFIPELKKKVFELKATGFSFTFPLTNKASSIEETCIAKLKDFVEEYQI